VFLYSISDGNQAELKAKTGAHEVISTNAKEVRT
jgi:hypothetical protein